MLTVSDVSLRFSDRKLFDDVNKVVIIIFCACPVCPPRTGIFVAPRSATLVM